MDIFEATQGTTLPIAVTLRNDLGDPITTYDGTQALSAEVSPGGARAALFSPTATWLDPSAGTISIVAAGSDLAGLPAGRYRGRLILEDPDLGPLEAYGWGIDLREAPGEATAPRAYVDFGDLLDHGRGWLRDLQTEDDSAGFAEYCGKATAWLDDLILGSWAGPGFYSLGEPGSGAYSLGLGGNNYPSPWLRQQLEAGGLFVSGLVREITAKKALSFILEAQIGPGEKGQAYAELGRRYGLMANNLARTLRAEINRDAAGNPAVVINLGARSIRG